MSERGSSKAFSVDVVGLELDVQVGVIGVALFAFEGEREDMLTFNQGEIVTVTQQTTTGWWSGFVLRRSNTGLLSVEKGIFPYSYVELAVSEEESDLFPLAQALYTLDPDTVGQQEEAILPLTAGETVTILRYVNEDWTYGQTIDGKEGLFPVKYVKTTGEFDVNMLSREKARWNRLTETREKMLEALKAQLNDEEIARTKREHLELNETISSLKEQNEKQRQELNEARRLLALARSEITQLKVVNNPKLSRRRGHMSLRFNAPPGPPPSLSKFEEDPFKQHKTMRKKHKQIMRPTYEDTPITESVPESPPVVENVSKVFQAGTLKKKPPVAQSTGSLVQIIVPAKDTLESTEEPDVQVYRQTSQVASRFRTLGQGPKCRICGKSVGIKGMVKACSHVYHDYCFRCATCNKVIRNGEYVDNHDIPYCNKCHKRGFGPQGVGNGLGEVPIPDKMATGEVSTQSWV